MLTFNRFKIIHKDMVIVSHSSVKRKKGNGVYRRFKMCIEI